MNREEIIRMARKAGLIGKPIFTEGLEHFAALVASAERERLTDAAMKAAEKAVDVAIALEREACAAKAEQVGQHKNHIGIAAAIRARGQA